MTEQTKLAVQQATDAVAAAKSEATRAKRACVEQIAADLPARVTAIAKSVAKAQPDVTKHIGADNIESMRALLRTAADNLGRTVVASVDSIDWPVAGEYGTVETYDINSALIPHFLSRTSVMPRLMEDHGYTPESNDFHITKLYDQTKFADVGKALTTLGRAQVQLKKAQEADDDATVEELWGE